MLTAVVFNAQPARTGSDGDSLQVITTKYCIISLTNGTQVSGSLISQENGQVIVKDPILGELSILQSNIESMRVVETGKEYTFIMSSGKKYRGVVEAQNETGIVIRTSSLGQITLTTANISDFNSGIADPALAGRIDHGSRYLFAPSAIPLKKGEGYYQNIYILMNGVHYGITDNFSIGGGVVGPVGLYGTMKYGHQVGKNVHVAAGGMVVTTMMGIGFGVGCGFGSVTFGDRWTNATVTAGYGAVMVDGGWEATKRPILNLSGMIRVSNNFSFITENYFIPMRDNNYVDGTLSDSYHYNPQFSGGCRIGGGKHTFDLALTTVGDVQEMAIVIPYFAYAYRFQNNKVKKH